MKKVLLVLVIIALSFGLTLHMYFWQDDSALMFKLQHPFEQMGSFGNDLIGNGAYKYLVLPFSIFYPLFGLNPVGYFLVGILTYVLATWCMYLFTKELLKNTQSAFFVTLVFAAGYVASDTMFRVINSWQTNIGLSLVLLCLYFLGKYHNLKRSLFYWFSLIFFLLSVEFVYVRTHSFIFAVFALDLLFTFTRFSKKELGLFVLRQMPFWIVFWYRYVVGDAMGSGSLSVLLTQLAQGKFDVFSALFATVGNAFIPTVFQEKMIAVFSGQFMRLALFGALLANTFLILVLKLPKRNIVINSVLLVLAFIINRHFISLNQYWYRTPNAQLSGLIGLLITSFAIGISISLYKKYRTVSIALLFALVVVVSQIFGYFIQYPDAIFGTTHRYLSHSLIGVALFFGILTYLLSQKIYFHRSRFVSFLPLVAVLLTFLVLGREYQTKILNDRSIPTQQFYKDLQSYVPEVEKGDVFYFDVNDGSFYQQQFNDFFSVGSMPETTAIALYYGVDRYDVIRFLDYDEFIAHISSFPGRYHSFYYGPEGLVHTTDMLQKALTDNSSEVTPVGKLICSTDVTLEPKIISNEISPEVSESLDYLQARNEFYNSVKVVPNSEWRYQEVENVYDENPQTSWRGHRIYWAENQTEHIVIDLGSVKSIHALGWQNWHHTLTPISYKIDTSIDQTAWQIAKEVTNGIERKDGEFIYDTFSPINARYVRMTIMNTITNDSPALSEIEVVESEYTPNYDLINALLASPAEYISSPQQLTSVLPFIPIVLTTQTNDGKKVSYSPVTKLGRQTIEFVVPSGGTQMLSQHLDYDENLIQLTENFLSCRNMTLQDLKSRNLVKRFVEN